MAAQSHTYHCPLWKIRRIFPLIVIRGIRGPDPGILAKCMVCIKDFAGADEEGNTHGR